jgi:hypothetical protein
VRSSGGGRTTEGGNRDLRWKEWSLGARLLGFGCKNLR